MDANVRFEVFMGVAYVKGTVRSKDQHAAVLELAHQVPGVVQSRTNYGDGLIHSLEVAA